MLDTMLSRRKALQVGAAAAGLTLLPGATCLRARQDDHLLEPRGHLRLEDPNDKTKKPEDFYISQAIGRFQAANPGLIVQMESLPGDTSAFTKYRTASVAKNGPDIMGVWSGSYLLALKDFLEPMAPFFTAEERTRILGWDAVSVDFKADSDQIFGVPASSDGTTCVFYNKDLLDKAGVDPEGDWRTSFDAFVEALDAIKASGMTPLGLDENAIIWQILAWWLAQELGGSAVVGELVSGERNFADAPLPEIVANWQKLNAYTVPGAETMPGDSGFRLMLPGDVAASTAGFWAITSLQEALGDKLGMVKMPNFSAEAPIQNGGIGGVGNALVVSNYSQVKDEAVAFIKFLMSKEEQTLKAESGEGRLLNVTDVDTAKYYDPMKQTQQEWGAEPSTVFWLDNLLPAGSHQRDQGAVATGLDRADQCRGVPGQGRRQARRATGDVRGRASTVHRRGAQ